MSVLGNKSNQSTQKPEKEHVNTRPKTLTNAQIRPMAVLSRIRTSAGQNRIKWCG